MLLRKIIVSSAALTTAALISFYLDQAEFYWLVLTTLIVMQIPHGSQTRTALQIVSIMIICVLAATVAQFNIILYSSLTSLTLITAAYIFWINRYSQHFTRYLLLLIPFTFLISGLYSVHSFELAKYRCLAILLGALTALVYIKLFLKFNAPKAFRKEIVPVINCLASATKKLAQDFAGKKMFPMSHDESIIKEMMENQCYHYPEWVYSPGFNPGLRSGMRYFLIHIERVSEILYSLDSLVSYHIPEDKWAGLADHLAAALERNKELLLIINGFFQNQIPISVDDGYTKDITELDDNLRQILPKELALIDIDPANLVLASVVREIKDMRSILLQLTLITQKSI